MRKHLHFLILFFSFFSLITSSNAQEYLGSINGFITDANGKSIPGVTISSIERQYTVKSDENGYFTIRRLRLGNYSLRIRAVGFKPKEVNLKIISGKPTNIDVRLDESVSEIEEVSVSGKSAIKEVRETPFNVVALDAKSQYNSTLDLAHLLDKASGVKIRETGGVGSDMNITLNGFTGRNIRVFMDGVPMEGMGTAFQLNNIPVNIAERIEVYKGVVPIEFGADAMGGAINIVTNRTSNTTLDASYSYGSFNTHKTNVSLNHTFRSGISLQLSTFQNYSDNNYKVKTVYRIFADKKTTGEDDGDQWQNGPSWSPDSGWFKRFHDKYRNETVIAKVGIVGKKWADRMLFGITMGQVHQDIQNGAEMKFVYGERTAHSKSILPSFVYDKRNLIVDGLSVRITGNYNYQKSGTVDTSSYKYSWTGDRTKIQDLRGQTNSFGEANYGLSEYSNRNQSGTVNIGYKINENHSFSFNDALSNYIRKPDLKNIAETKFPDLPNEADSMDRASVKNTMGIEYRYTYHKKWNTNIFAKHYLNKANGPQVDPTNTLLATRVSEKTDKVGYGVATSYFFTGLQLKASAERAYRLPNDRELFGDEILEQGNIMLKPEESDNFNLGFTWNKELHKNFTFYLDWAGYYRNTNNFIKTVLTRVGDDINGNSMYARSNHGRVTRLGTDIETRIYYKEKITLGATFTYMDIRDKERFTDLLKNKENGNYGYRMPNLPYFFWNADASYYFHDFMGKGNTLNLNYAFNFVDKIYLNSGAYADKSTRAFIPKQTYSDFSATYIMQNGKYNVSFEAHNIEDALLYDNFSLQKPGRSFSVKLRYFFIKKL
jgi:outer membrane receptor protein involved in Fe transport